MKKIFLIFGMAGCLSLVNGINNANALSDGPTITLNYTCPDGCTLRYVQTINDAYVQCVKDMGGGRFMECANPVVNIGTTNTTVNLNDYNIVSIPANMSVISEKKIESKKSNNVSARAARINTKPVNVLARAQDKVADGGAVAINCPAGCTPDCAILGNVVLCECKASDGSTCKADVVTSENTTGVK